MMLNHHQDISGLEIGILAFTNGKMTAEESLDYISSKGAWPADEDVLLYLLEGIRAARTRERLSRAPVVFKQALSGLLEACEMQGMLGYDERKHIEGLCEGCGE